MAVPSGISQQGIKIWNFISNAIQRGLGANQTLTSLKTQGLGYRRTTFLEDYRLAGEIEEKESTMKFIRKDLRISDTHYSPSVHPLAGGFRQTVFEIKGYDTKSKMDVTRHVTIAHDYVSTRSDLELDAILTIQGTSPWLDVTSIMPVVARKWPEDYYA